MSRENDFLKGMGRLSKFFNKKFSDGQLEIYYEVGEKIPSEAWKTIVEHIIDTCKTMPARKEIRRMWLEWLASNPDKLVTPEPTECDKCGGSGGIDFWYIPKDRKDRGVTWDKIDSGEMQKAGRIYKGVARCGNCSNWKGRLPRSLIRKTRDELEELGARPIEIYRETDDDGVVIPKGGVEGLAKEAINKIPEGDEVPF